MVKYKVILILLSMLLIGCKQDKQVSTAPSESTPSSIEEDPITITPIQHASAVIQADGKTIYIDPTGSAADYAQFPKADMVLITDIHGDHMNIDTLESLDLDNSKIVAPEAVAERLPAQYTSNLVVLRNGETINLNGIILDGIPMYNLREEAKKFHPKGRGNGYVITIADERLYFSGDTEDIPEMRALQYIDRAFICMNLPYTMTVEKAADAALAFKPKKVYPYHYRGKGGFSDVAKFKEIVATKNPNIKIVELDWYPEKG